MMNPLDWVDQYCATITDVPSLRHMHRFIREDMEKEAGFRASIVEQCGEEVAVREWDDPAQLALNKRRRDALTSIEKRLEEIGAEL